MKTYPPAAAAQAPAAAPLPQLLAATAHTLPEQVDRIHARTLLLRGAQSDLLSPETAQAMERRGPRAKLVEFEGVGHAPTLMAQGQVQVVSEFLLAPEATAVA